jgi:CheY-like chemotaxis protein
VSHILVIEADESLRAAVATLLELAGYTVSTAADGAAGVAALHAQPPDLLLCALKLPFVDGIDLLRALRQNPATANVPLIFLTTHLAKADLRRGIELGANGYLITPFKEEELLRAIQNTLASQT